MKAEINKMRHEMEKISDIHKAGYQSLILAVWVLALLLPVRAGAVGFRLPNQDPEAIARGNAFVATADNPSAIFYNPAGITLLEGHNLSAGLYFISANTRYTSPTGAVAKTKSDFQTVPQFHYVYSPKDSPLSFGLGVYVPYGLSLEWTGNNTFKTLAEEGKLLYVTVNPVVAWQIHPTFSIGAGPTLNYSKAELKRGIGFLPGDQFKFSGDAFDVGFNAGALWQPHPKWSFGANYRYLTTMNYAGTSEASPYSSPTKTSGSLRFPQYVVAGVSFRPTEDWNFEMDVDWTDWDNVNQIKFHGTAGGDQVFPLNYQSSLMYEFGVTRKLGKGFFLSAGYIFSENSIPDKDFNPIIPDSNLHLGSIGFGRKGQRWSWAAAYTFAFNPGRDVKNSQSTSLIGESANGTYRTLNHAVTVSGTLKF